MGARGGATGLRAWGTRARLGVLGVVALAVAGTSGIAPAHAASDDSQLQGAEQLLALTPASARGQCSQIDPTDVNANIAGAIAGVICAPGGGVDSVLMLLMQNNAALNIAYTSDLALANGSSPDPDTCPDDGTWSYTDGTNGGSKACGQQDAGTQLVWTGDAANVVGLALSASNDIAALEKWWESNSAPLLHADTVRFASTAPAARRAAAKKLLSATGDSAGCKQVDADVSKFQSGSLEWRWLPWLSAGLRCQSPDHQGPVEYFQLTPGASATFAEQLKEETVGSTKPRKSSSECDDTRDLLNDANKLQGQVGCFYVGSVLWAYWYHDAAHGDSPGMVGAMPADGFNSPKQLYAFLTKHGMF
jgi:hypothetical protein